MAWNWFKKKYWKVKLGPLLCKLNYRCFLHRNALSMVAHFRKWPKIDLISYLMQNFYFDLFLQKLHIYIYIYVYIYINVRNFGTFAKDWWIEFSKSNVLVRNLRFLVQMNHFICSRTYWEKMKKKNTAKNISLHVL